VTRPRLILAGVVGRYPVGGVTWCALHYIAGFQRLGFDVFYLEDTGECGFDPVANGISTDPAYAVRYLRRELARVGLEDAWAYVDYTGRYHGASRERVAAVCRDAELMVDLSGGCWISRPEYDSLPRVFIDTDPGFTQRAIADAGEGWYHDFFAAHDALFTFALNVDDPACGLAETPFEWRPTLQPLVLDFWPVLPAPPGAPYTTVMSWRIDSFPGLGRGKGGDVFRVIDLPAKAPSPILLALAGRAPTELLAQHGWQVTDALQATVDTDAYRSFVRRSKAELGFAKGMYVETRSGWFSDRSECYLASGRPALVRDTGFGRALPCGEGLLAFEDERTLLEGMREIDADYPRHARAARELAEEYFASDRVLARLLDSIPVPAR
jgi:hypothetical protein